MPARRAPDMSTFDYDVVVIGSGFGGSVTAPRLAEKGYRVGAGGGPALRRRRIPADVLAAADLPGRRDLAATASCGWSC